MGKVQRWIVGAVKPLRRVSGTFTSLKGTVGSGKNSVPTTWNRVTNEPTLTPSG
jgi:hypothetical protein